MFQKINTTNIVLLLIVLYFITSWFKKAKGIANNQLNVDSDNANLTIDLATATEYANALESAFAYTFGTDEDALLNILNLLSTKEDFALVNETFGTRIYGVFGDGNGANPKTLIEWVKTELNEDEVAYQTFKEKFNSIGVYNI